MAKCLYFRQTMANPEQIFHTSSAVAAASAAHSASMEGQCQQTGVVANGHAVHDDVNEVDPLAACHCADTASDTINLRCSGLENGHNGGSDDVIVPGTDGSQDQWEPFLASLGGPSLSDAILETDKFLQSIGISDDGLCKMESDPPPFNSGHSTPTNNDSPILTPKMGSPVHSTPIEIPASCVMPLDANNHSYPSSNCSSVASDAGSSASWGGPRHVLLRPDPLRHNGSFRSLASGLDPIPENGVSKSTFVYQPLVPPAVPKPVTTSYNISFPTTLQPRDRFDLWLRTNLHFQQQHGASTGYASPGGTSSSVPASPGSHSSLQSPFDGAIRSTPWDPSEYQPLNLIEESKTKKRSRQSASAASAMSAQAEEEDLDDGASSRQRRKSAFGAAASTSASASASSTENKRRDSIKFGLEELQRVLPHIGTPEEERISQASVLFEGGKYIRALQDQQTSVSDELEAVKKQIDELNNQIEALQAQLPDSGAPLLPKVMTALERKTLPDQFHDHVVERTVQDWRYWVFVSIMGHFVHAFEQQVSAVEYEDLQTTALEFVGNNLSLQQLRKDAYRKLAKLCAKTSIVDAPAKLPEEALAFVSKGDRAFKKDDGS